MSDQVRSEGPTVFLSYAHDDEAHVATVLDLASLLVSRGIAVELDHWHSDRRRDWYAWMLRGIQAADFVIVVASPGYGAVGDGTSPHNVHRGVQAETAALRDLLYRDREMWLGRVLPVVLPGRSLDELPTFTQPYSGGHFNIDSITDDGVDELLRVLTGQPRHVKPRSGRIPDLSDRSNATSVGHGIDTIPTRIVYRTVGHLARRLRSGRPDRWAALAGAACAMAVVGLLLMPGFSWIGAMLISGIGLAVLVMARRYPQGSITKVWKIAILVITPLLAGGAIALPGNEAPVVDTANDTSGAPDYSGGQEPATATESASNAPSTVVTASASSQSGPGVGREPTEEEFRQAKAAKTPGITGTTSTSDGPSRQGSLDILALGHSFIPGTDRITIMVRNTHSDPVLVKEIGIYMSDWAPGHGWTDPNEWHFTAAGQMHAGAPGFDGTIRTHGVIKMDGAEFSEPLVGQGYVNEKNGTWRRLLTFSPRKFLEGAGTVSIVVDLPTTHLLQKTSPSQPAGPIVEHTFDPAQGSFFTRVDLRTPEDATFACDYLRRPPDQPICDTVDPLASVALPR